MRVWLITIGEPLPTDGPQERLLRTGMLAEALAAVGHEVVWWSSTFDHVRKRQRFCADTSIAVGSRYQLNLLHAVAYAKNISFLRLANHYGVARAWSKWAYREPKPDVMLCSFPTIGLSRAATRYGRVCGIPVVLDVRDLWPDIFPGPTEGWGRWMKGLALAPLVKATREAFKTCTAVVGVSERYLRWGLSYAGRPAGEHDRVFAIGYKKPHVTAGDLTAAEMSLRDVGVNPEKKIAWFVGSLGTTYDLIPLIQAARRLGQQGQNDIQFVFSGEGGNGLAYRRLAEGMNNVVFTGWMDSHQIAWLMRVSRVGLMAYAAGAPQGLPNKLFEYLGAGLPVLSALSGETEALLSTHECGLTYTPGDTDSFLKALLTLLDNASLSNQMGRNAASLFTGHYTAEKINAEIIRHLERVCAEGHERRAA